MDGYIECERGRKREKPGEGERDESMCIFYTWIKMFLALSMQMNTCAPQSLSTTGSVCTRYMFTAPRVVAKATLSHSGSVRLVPWRARWSLPRTLCLPEFITTGLTSLLKLRLLRSSHKPLPLLEEPYLYLVLHLISQYPPTPTWYSSGKLRTKDGQIRLQIIQRWWHTVTTAIPNRLIG